MHIVRKIDYAREVKNKFRFLILRGAVIFIRTLYILQQFTNQDIVVLNFWANKVKIIVDLLRFK